MLELLWATVFNHGGHRLEGAVVGLRPSMHIAASHARAVSRARAKQMAITVEEPPECFGHSVDQRYS